MVHLLLVNEEPGFYRQVQSVLAAELGEDFSLTVASDETQARAAVQSDQPIDAVLLDLGLSQACGFDLMDEMYAARPGLAIIVISGAGSEQAVVEALQRGAMSYLGKSTIEHSLAPTIHKVVDANRKQQKIQRVRDGLTTVRMQYELENDPALIRPLLDDVRTTLERFNIGGENTTQLIVGVEEAVANAMYHGNLEIGSELKHNHFAEFFKQAEEARKDPRLSRRSVRLFIDASHDGARITVADDGQGFDPQSIPDPTAPENLVLAHGRGLLMMRTFFDDVRFNKLGNAVTLTVKSRESAVGGCTGSIEDAA
jgi:DNA-binding response OmpR family regulator